MSNINAPKGATNNDDIRELIHLSQALKTYSFLQKTGAIATRSRTASSTTLLSTYVIKQENYL